MTQGTKYEVMKFTEQGERCYKGSDCIYGELLGKYIQNNPYIEKTQVFFWISELIKQINQYHKCKGQRPYQYVNPYMMVVNSQEEITLIDTQARSNELLIKTANSLVMREHFLPDFIHDYSASDVMTDIYGIGKSIQYVFAMTAPDPKLTIWEEWSFRKIIRNCLNVSLKKGYQIPYDIFKHFPKRKNKV